MAMSDPFVREIGVVVDGDARTIPLSGAHAAGRAVIMDAADYETAACYSWSATSDPRRADDLYASAVVNGATVTMHKFLTGYPLTDHRNHDGLDNRRSNLRPVTHAQNLQNQRPRDGGASRHKGVHWHKQRQKWAAQITCDGKKRHLGMFATEGDAARAYDAAARELFGEYACLNFPDKTTFSVPASIRLGVSYGAVTLRTSGAVELPPVKAEEFAQLYVSACWAAARDGERLLGTSVFAVSPAGAP